MTIERKTVSALKWAAAARVVVQLVSWVGTLLVIRLLTPDDYGLMAKVSVVSGIAGVLAEFGLGAAIIRAKDLSGDELRKIFGVSLLFGACITLLIVAASPLLALLLRDSRLTWPIAGAALQILVGAIVLVPASLAARDLSFRHLSKIEIASGISTVLGTLLLAYSGFGVWALVLGTLTGGLVRAIALWRANPPDRPLFSTQGIAEHLKFGFTLVIGRVSYFIVSQADVVIGSAFLSTTAIGQYAVALQLATLPMSKVMGTINAVALPAVARQQGDLAGLRSHLLSAIEVIALLAFPVIWAISALAPELVRTLFGPTWEPAVTALQILPLIVPVRMIHSVLQTTAIALGLRRSDLRNTLTHVLIIPAGFFIGVHWGLVGLCLSWLVSVPMAYAICLRALLQGIGVSFGLVVSALAAPMAAAAVMYGAIVLARHLLPGWPPAALLLVLGLVGASCYLATLALLSPRHLRAGLGFARLMMNKPAPASPPSGPEEI